MTPALLDKLKSVPAETGIGMMIKTAIERGNITELEKTLIEYYHTSPEGLNKVLQFDLSEYL